MKEIKLSDGRVVKMRKPKVRDMRAVANIKNEIERELHLVSNLTGLSVEELDDLSLDDYRKLQEVLEDFLK